LSIVIGEWREEWHALADQLQLPELRACTTTEWEFTDCFLDNSDSKMRLNRPYIRVDRVKMQSVLRDKYSEAGGMILAGKLAAQCTNTNLYSEGLVHTHSGSKLTLQDGTMVDCKVVVDATGLDSKLTSKESPLVSRAGTSVGTLPVGVQIAYGFIAEVDNLGPYDDAAMTLFDYRTDYAEYNSTWFADVQKRPTVSVYNNYIVCDLLCIYPLHINYLMTLSLAICSSCM
jgi:lycopene beta-cyclase